MKSSDTMASPAWRLSAAEIHFLYWFIQGSIMNPETRLRLQRAWGFCERHACGYFAVETAFRNSMLHGVALLYEDLMERATRAFSLFGPWQSPRLRWRLRDRGPCLMCEVGLGPASPTIYAPAGIVGRGSRIEPLRAFAACLRPFWEQYVCGQCTGCASPVRCRCHLLAERGTVDLALQRSLVIDIAKHVTTFARSFRFECRGTETDADRAGLIGALGWCSGWHTWLTIVGGQPRRDAI